MAYTANTPQATDRINDTQPLILANFQGIQTLINVNHGTFGAADEGKHKWVTMPENAAPTASAVNEAVFYANVGANSGVTELYWQRENNGTRTPMTEFSGAIQGYTYLPSGLLMKWDRELNVSGNTQINSNAFGPAFAVGGIYQIQLSPATTRIGGGGQAIQINMGLTLSGPPGDTTIRVYVSERTTVNDFTADAQDGFEWVAIGLPA